jgi:4-alpha-glucanotransferase
VPVKTRSIRFLEEARNDLAREKPVTTTADLTPRRSAGILLHPTSLPGSYGIGDLGPVARQWIDVLAAARQTWWQILPLGPTGYGDSPYQCFSAFAGNPYLVSPELLLHDGLLRDTDLAGHSFPADRVDYGPVISFKIALLARAWERFGTFPPAGMKQAFEEFNRKNALWLDDYALFRALKDAQEGKSWHDWTDDLKMRKPAALDKARRHLANEIARHRFAQFLFFRQWLDLKRYANSKGIRLLGDAPIFVSTDSSDVWANPDLFQLDSQRRPTVVAGVPPDYFSPTGQLWGNPHYNWEAMRRTGYAWWVARLKATLAQVDVIRLDHFRGFESCWEVPAGQKTAEHGRWVKVPGAELFNTVRSALGNLPLVAEDLGLITPEVDALRLQFNLPGMRILQFAFSGPDNRFLPHHYDRNTVVYTGTHDNDTTLGWYATLPHHEREFMERYYPGIGRDIAWELTRVAWASVADRAIVPLQDLLRLPTTARMNFPGRTGNNWQWRFLPGQVNPELVDRLAGVTWLYSRA